MKKSYTFTQRVISILMVVSVIWVTWSFVLATIGKEPVENLSIAIVSTLIIALLGYFVKNLGEKNSRNKYKVDENGIPWEVEHGYNDGNSGFDTIDNTNSGSDSSDY